MGLLGLLAAFWFGPAAPTFSHDIASLLYRRCANCHHAFVTVRDRLLYELGGALLVSGEHVRNQRAGRRKLRQRSEAPRLRLIQKRLSIEVQQIEPERAERQLGAHAVEIELAIESPRGQIGRAHV